MIRHTKFILPVLALPALVAACGDDLESRQAAIDESGPPQNGDMVLIPGRQASDGQTSPGAAGATPMRIEDIEDGETNPEYLEDGMAIPPAGADGGDSLVVDAAPDDLIDSARGFSPEPMDNASGIDPAPNLDDDWGE